MAADDELAVMTAIAEELRKLDEAAQHRVLRWIADKFGLSLAGARGVISASTPHVSFDGDAGDLASMSAKARPKTDAEKALVAAYWAQHVNGERDFSSQSINTQLKQLGHGVSNITSALSSLMSMKPQLVIQVQKSGKSQQARKKYRVTGEGIKRVQDMLRGDGED